MIFSTLSKLEPSLHSTTFALATSTPSIICLIISPFLKLPVALTTTKIELDLKVDPTVLSKWYAPPLLEIVILFGKPIVLLSAYADTSDSTISISGAKVYPLPGLLTVIENICPCLIIISKVAPAPSPFVITTFGLD